MIDFEGKFQYINNNAIKIINPLSTDEAFLRFCRVLTNDPLNEPVDLGELSANFIDTSENDGLVVLSPIDETISTSGKVRVHFHPALGRDDLDNQEIIYDDFYQCLIVVPKAYEILQGKGTWRYIAIAQRIAKHIDNKQVAGIGRCKIVDWEVGRVSGSPDYVVMTLMIGVQNVKSYGSSR